MPIVNREELLYALEKVKPGVAAKEIIEQTTHFSFLGNVVATYNDEISIRHPVKFDTPIYGVVKAEELYELLSKLTGETIAIEVTESELVLNAKNVTAGLTLQSEVLLPLGEINLLDEWRPLPKKFTQALHFCLPAITTDMSFPALSCINVRQDGIVEASDNFRLSRYNMGKKMPVPTFLLPGKAAKTLINFDVVETSDGGGWKHFKTKEGTIFSARVFEDTFPDTEASGIVDVEGDTVVLPETLIGVMERATIFAKREHKLDAEATITIGNKRIKVESRSDYGWFSEERNLRYTGEPRTIIVQPEFLHEILPKLTSCIIGPNSIKFTSEEWEHVIRLKGGE